MWRACRRWPSSAPAPWAPVWRRSTPRPGIRSRSTRAARPHSRGPCPSSPPDCGRSCGTISSPPTTWRRSSRASRRRPLSSKPPRGPAWSSRAVAEDLDVKRAVFAELDAYCPDGALFTSTTSYLDVYQRGPGAATPVHGHRALVRAAADRPARRGRQGRADQRGDRRGGASHCSSGSARQLVVMDRFVPGFCVNRLLRSIGREVFFLLDNGYLTPEQLDAAVKASLVPRALVLGFVQRYDFTGLDLSLGQPAEPRLRGAAAGRRATEPRRARRAGRPGRQERPGLLRLRRPRPRGRPGRARRRVDRRVRGGGRADQTAGALVDEAPARQGHHHRRPQRRLRHQGREPQRAGAAGRDRAGGARVRRRRRRDRAHPRARRAGQALRHAREVRGDPRRRARRRAPTSSSTSRRAAAPTSPSRSACPAWTRTRRWPRSTWARSCASRAPTPASRSSTCRPTSRHGRPR